jgi:hypothetical protein
VHIRTSDEVSLESRASKCTRELEAEGGSRDTSEVPGAAFPWCPSSIGFLAFGDCDVSDASVFLWGCRSESARIYLALCENVYRLYSCSLHH